MAETENKPGTVQEPYRGYNFKLDIGGKTQGHFTYVSGLGAEVEAIEYRAGGQSQVVHRLPGRVSYGEVTLSYGLTASDDLWKWFLSAVEGNVQRRHVSIILLDSAGVATVCARCGRAFCRRCKRYGGPAQFCARCVRLYTRK